MLTPIEEDEVDGIVNEIQLKDLSSSQNILLSPTHSSTSSLLDKGPHFSEEEDDIQSIKSAPPVDENTKTPIRVFIYVYFIVIAGVLGTGILGLPVKLSRSGFSPFVVSYTVCFFMQAFVIYFVIELLQRASLNRVSEANSLNPTQHTAHENASLENEGGGKFGVEKGDVVEEDIIEEGRSSVQAENVVSGSGSHGPDLHYLGVRFLGKISRKFFDLAVLLHFVSILISYGLAGSEAYGHLFHVPYQYLIAPFVVVLTLVIVFGSNILQPVISIFTFAKGMMLVMIVFVTGVVAAKVQNPISNDWVFIGRPFLIGTVALGGASNVLPIIFPRIVPTKREMRKLLIVATAGLSTVYFLNVLWCFYLLRIIPQMPTDLSGDDNEVTLYNAEQKGLIATVPLIDIIKSKYSQFNWIATLVDIFIMISITVSFVTMGSGLRHTLEGLALTWRRLSHAYTLSHDDSFSLSSRRPLRGTVVTTKWKKFTRSLNKSIDEKEQAQFRRGNPPVLLREGLLYLSSFGLVLMIALLNPKGFINVMEFAASLGVNLQSGIFVVMMLITARTQQRRYLVPYALPNWIFNMRYVVMFYFSFAVFYDILGLIGKVFFT